MMGKTIYYNGTILTMEDACPITDTVMVQDGRIISPKTQSSVESNTRYVNLKGAVMLPAFLDSHSHFSGYASAQLQVPLEEAVSFAEIVEKIRAYVHSHQVPAGAWITGKGYDHNQLTERSHPTAAILDQAAPNNPVMIQHQSGHMGVFNTAALRLLGVTAHTPDPQGGLIARENGSPTGYMEENAFIRYQQKVPMASLEELANAYVTIQNKYASYGITTVQEGMLPAQLLPLYQMLLQKDLLKLDLVGFADAKDARNLLPALAEHRRIYKKHFKLGGLKIFLDGSPQGRTAWMRTPYAGSLDYCGYPTLTDEQVEGFVRLAAQENLQLLAHCNGDAAAAQYLHACRKVSVEGYDIGKIRPVLVHGQLLGTDQLPELKQLGIIPSFFVAHVFHWGDVHIQNFGMERAARICPAASAMECNIPFTFHQDTPVIEPDMLETIWCSVNRITKASIRLDAEAIPVREALKAVTVNAARQYFEENEKGSILPGKRADFVILDKNPLAVPAMELKNIRVLQTIKDNQCIYECR